MERDVEGELNPRKCHDVHEDFSFKEEGLKNFNHGEKQKKIQLMGILNCTPDSFYDGGNFFDPEKAIERGEMMETEGADIVDIGGESSRPSASFVSETEEIERVIPVIKALSSKIKIPLSIDTSKSKVAEKALLAGATMINDIYGFRDPSMRAVAKEADVPICVMHMQGTPQTMQFSPSYPHGVVKEITDWLQRRIEQLLKEGVDARNIIVDPGIGFGKTVEQIIEILKHLRAFTALGFPVLIGLSRKSFLSKILGKPATELLSTTLALNTMSILEGASLIRVHDVKEHRDVLDVLARFQPFIEGA